MEKNEIKQSLWTKDFTINFFAAFFLFLGFSSFLPTLPMYVERYSSLTGSAGIPLAALTLGAVLTRSLAGWALDVYGRKIILFIGLLIFLISTTTFIAMLPAIFLFLFRFIQGTGWGLANTGFSTIAADLAPSKRLGEAIGVYTISVTAALGLGPLMGMWLIDHYSFSFYFKVVSMLVVISIILSSFIKVPSKKIEAGTEKPKFAVLQKKCIIPFIVVMLCCFNYAVPQSFIALHATEKGLGTGALFFSIFAISTLICRPITGRYLDGKGDKGFLPLIILGAASLGLSSVILGSMTTTFIFGLGSFIYGIGYGIFQPTLLALCIKLVSPEEMGGANGTFWLAFDGGIFLGSMSWGLVAAATGYAVMFALAAIPALLAIVIYLLYNPLTAKTLNKEVN